MRSGQVYQPTTATLPNRGKSWLPSFSGTEHSSPWNKFFILGLATLFALMGLVMITVGATSYQNVQESTIENDKSSAYITVLCVGVLFEIVAITIFVFYYRQVGYYIPCCPGKIARIRKCLQENRVGNKGQMHGNHTAPVSAQYCPPPAPPLGNSLPFTDVSEQQRLMEEKNDVTDENEKILDEDPRIVLSPLKSKEEC